MKLEITKPNPPIKLEEINSFESEFKITIPKEYKNFLLKNNGGFCNIDIDIYYETEDSFNSEIFVSEFYKLEEVAHFIRCKDKTISINECYKNGTIIIAGYDIQEISIGFQKNNFGKIFHSIYLESVSLQLIAKNFNHFINNFIKRPTFSYGDNQNQEEVDSFTKWLMGN